MMKQSVNIQDQFLNSTEKRQYLRYSIFIKWFSN